MSLHTASQGWPDLPDPTVPGEPDPAARCVVRLTAQRWEHFRARHMSRDTEPWGEWLGQAALPGLRRPLREGGVTPAEVDEAVERIRQEVCHCLERPLVLLYEGVVWRGPGRPTWLLVLPSGARVAIRQQPRTGNEVRTCFFPRAACREDNPARRWRAHARKLVWRFAVFNKSLNALVSPPEDHVFPGGQGEAARCRVRFVTLPSWGFRSELRGGPWRGSFPDWPPDVTPQVSQPNRFRLKRPHPRQEERDG